MQNGGCQCKTVPIKISKSITFTSLKETINLFQYFIILSIVTKRKQNVAYEQCWCFFFFFLFHPLTSVALVWLQIRSPHIVWLWIWIKRGILNLIGKFLFLPYIHITGEKERYWKSKNNFITYSFKILKTMLWVGQSFVYFAWFCKKIKIFKEYQFPSGHSILFLILTV